MIQFPGCPFSADQSYTNDQKRVVRLTGQVQDRTGHVPRPRSM